MSDSLAKAVRSELTEHGVIRPPWAVFPDMRRRSIGWRMGAGEWQLDKFHAWWKSEPDVDWDAYLHEFEPIPFEWVDWAARILDVMEGLKWDERDAISQRLVDVGFEVGPDLGPGR